MNIEINGKGEIDIDALADALDSSIESKVDAFVDSAIDNYNFYDIVRDETQEAIGNTDFSYEVESCLEESEIDRRVTELELTIARIAEALPNKALDVSKTEKEELQKRYDLLESKFKKMAGIEDAAENTED